MGFFKEFKAFALRGNVVDLAVAVVIGGAFGKITTSLVNDLIMPPLGLLIGGRDLKNEQWVLKPAVVNEETGQVVTQAVALRYGAFVSTIIDFLIIALAIFVVIRMMNVAEKRLREAFAIGEEGKPTPPPAPPSRQEQLLMEIRDVLREKKGA